MNLHFSAAMVATLVALGAHHTVAGADSRVDRTIAASPRAAAAAEPRRGGQQGVSVERSQEPSRDDGVEQQLRLRVFLPALSGDGGG